MWCKVSGMKAKDLLQILGMEEMIGQMRAMCGVQFNERKRSMDLMLLWV